VTFGARKGRYNTKSKPTRRYGPFRTISLLKMELYFDFYPKNYPNDSTSWKQNPSLWVNIRTALLKLQCETN
jgi:hypothetical protein